MKQLGFLIASTFLVGLMSGVYIYFISRPSEPIFNGAANDTGRGFEITADTYGGCQMTGRCPSYHIADDASYIYLVPERGGEGEQYRGELEPWVFNSLREELRETPLAKIERSDFDGSCPAHVDGHAYRYEIRVGEDRYQIDTCEQDTENARLFELLGSYFEAFADTHSP